MSQDGVPPGEPGSTPEAAAQTPTADVGGTPPVSPTTDPAAWPAPDQSTQVLDPDAQQTAAYPYQAQDPYQQQAGAYAQTQQTTAYPNAAYDYSQQTEQPPAAPQWPTPGADGYLPPPPGVTPTTAPPAPKSGGVGKFIAIAALTGLLAGVGGGALGYSLAQDSGTSSSVTVNAPSNPEGLSPRADGSIATIAEKVLPSVVSLEVSGSGQAGSGSGFVVSQDGYILTNNHVIEAAADNGSIEVVLQDGTRVTLIAGDLGELRAPASPPDSWAAKAEHDVAIWTIKMAAGARFELPAAKAGSNRTLYFFAGKGLKVAGREVPEYHLVDLVADTAVVLEAAQPCEMLLLQGQPIGEPVAQYGPFVMNDRAGIEQAFADYQRTGFGGWPWPADDPNHGPDRGRFARHADGRLEEVG